MSEPWSRPLEVDRLADGGAEVDFAVPLAELAGLPAGVGGSVAGRVRFARAQGFPVAELTVRGAATLECQRCRQPMSVPIDAVVQIALLASEDDVARAPAEFEPVLAAGGRISIAGLMTEELLLTLPIVPLHGGSGTCAEAAQAGAAPRGPVTHKPFAGLADLMKR